ncbi:MAG: sigma-70 family RNA polymerase sigma factor [Paraclostridium sp.]|uniref:sigma-70 family RNA polymerase sigma factor n=1 Tax=Paraclostridium sp. TaxID=2023273 RepID=UPI003F39B66E
MLTLKSRSLSIDDIIDKYSNTVYKLAFSRTKNIYDAQDIVQEVFMKVMLLNKNFESEEHLKSLILRITINTSKNLLTTAWFRKTTRLQDNLVTYIKEESEVYKYVFKLPTKYRTVIHLFYYEDLKTSEIAKLLELNENTVRSQLSRGRELLKKEMKGVELDVF